MSCCCFRNRDAKATVYAEWHPRSGRFCHLHYEGDAGTKKALPVAGLDSLGLKATLDALLIGGFYMESSVQQLIPAGKGFLSLGLEGFWTEQVTAARSP